MGIASPSFRLQLHLVPAGRRLDFTIPPGCYAYVYRRSSPEPWHCIAYNACSPYLDRSPLPVADASVEYVVHYCNAGGSIVTTSAVVGSTELHRQATPLSQYKYFKAK